MKCDIHCVTKWSKLDMSWQGVSLDVLLEGILPEAAYVVAFAEGDYTTNLPVADITDGQAWIATATTAMIWNPSTVDPLGSSSRTSISGRAPSGSAASASWSVTSPGFWERLGYNNYGDPWREQRYWGD